MFVHAAGATQPRSGPSPVPEIDFADRPAATAAGPLPPLPLAKAAAAVPLAGGRNWPLRPNAAPEERIRFLGTQLDALTATNDGVVLDRFKLLGAQARRPAGAHTSRSSAVATPQQLWSTGGPVHHRSWLVSFS